MYSCLIEIEHMTRLMWHSTTIYLHVVIWQTLFSTSLYTNEVRSKPQKIKGKLLRLSQHSVPCSTWHKCHKVAGAWSNIWVRNNWQLCYERDWWRRMDRESERKSILGKKVHSEEVGLPGVEQHIQSDKTWSLWFYVITSVRYITLSVVELKELSGLEEHINANG